MENIEYLKKQLSIMITLFETKRFDELIVKGITLIKKFPDQPIFYNLTSLAYNATGKSILAKELLLKILKIDYYNIIQEREPKIQKVLLGSFFIKKDLFQKRKNGSLQSMLMVSKNTQKRAKLVVLKVGPISA